MNLVGYALLFAEKFLKQNPQHFSRLPFNNVCIHALSSHEHIRLDTKGLEDLHLRRPEISGGLYPQFTRLLVNKPEIVHFNLPFWAFCRQKIHPNGRFTTAHFMQMWNAVRAVNAPCGARTHISASK